MGRVVFLVIVFAVMFQQAGTRAGSLMAIAPLGASPGATVQITGQGFAAAAADNDVWLTPPGGTPVRVTPASIATIDAAKGIRRLAIVIPPEVPTGPAAVRVVNKANNDVAEGRTLEVIRVTVAGPVSARRGTQGLAVRLTGSPNTQFVAGRTNASFGSGIRVVSSIVESPTSLLVTIDVLMAAALGPRNLTVVASTQTAVIAGGFAVEDVAPANAPPTVDAGGDRSITLPANQVGLNATVADDGLPSPPAALTYAWSQQSGPASVVFATPNAEDTTVTFPQAGVYVLRLSAGDGEATVYDEIAVTVDPPPNTPPTVSAGEDHAITLPVDRVAVNATAGDDGLPMPPGTLAFAWSQTSGPAAATFSAAGAEDTDILFTQAGSYVFRLTVSDGDATAFDEVAVIVSPRGNEPPSVSAGEDQTITLPSTVSLRGTAEDDGLPTPPGTLAYLWTKQDGPGTVVFAAADAAETSASFSAAGVYVLRLTVGDGAVDVSDEVTVTVNPRPNQPPSVNAGFDQSITLPVSQVSLNATVTDDGLPAPPAALTYTWTQQSGPGSVTFGTPAAEDTTAAFDQPGSYVLVLAVSDGQHTVSDSVQITLNRDNAAPRVTAPDDSSITLPATVGLDATTSDDGLPSPPGALTFNWTKQSGPGVVTFSAPGAEDTTASFSAPGTYVLRLTVADGSASAFDDVTVVAAARPNLTPTASAGPDRVVTLPVNTVQMTGAASDEGFPGPLVATWSLVSGPTAVAFDDASNPSTLATFNAAGTYVLRLRATDGEASAEDDVTVVVESPQVVQAVGAHAGGPYAGRVGEAVAFDGRASRDAAGETLTYTWDFGDGTSATGAAPSHIYSSTNNGTPFSVRLTVRTASGRTAEATTTAAISPQPPPPVPPPVANIGGPYSGLAGHAIAFDASQSSDPANRPLAFAWDFGDGTIGAGATPRHIYAAPAASGGYVVTLTVSNGAASDTRTTTVAIAAPAPENRAPSARPGGPYGADAGVSISFDGTTSSDPDGDPLTYAWTFGDGSKASGSTPSHAYKEAGNYIVALTVSDPAGARNTSTALVTVTSVPVSNMAPTARPGGPYSGDAGAALAFDGRGSRDPDGDSLTFAWSFGDGTSAAGATPTHSYGAAGQYTVELLVEDGRAGSDRKTVTATIGPPADRAAPTLSLRAPSSVLPGTRFVVEGVAYDNVAVASVAFNVSGAGSAGGSAEDASAPFEIDVVAAPTAAPGSAITISAVARDTSGNSRTASKTVAIVASPDSAAPAISLVVPPSAPAGGTVVLTATATDNVGVRDVRFSSGGSALETVTSEPYQITYVVPANAIAGSTLAFSVTARDFAGNLADAEASVTIVEAPPPSPPTIALTAPAEVTSSDVLHLGATAADERGIASVAFFIDDVRVATIAAAPYTATVAVPPGRSPGSVLRVRARALNVAALFADSVADVRVTAAPTAAGGVVGRVYDDTTGLPIEGATARLVGIDSAGRAYDAAAITDGRGRYFLPTNGGEAVVAVGKPGWTGAHRPVTFAADRAVSVFDARLTPLSPASPPIVALLGGTAVVADLTLAIPPGALASDTALRVTRLGPQGLPGLLPAGWTPVAAADVAPHDLVFATPATVTMAPAFPVPPSRPLVLVRWNGEQHLWEAAGGISDAPQGRVGASIVAGGQYAWVMADQFPFAPPPPAPGGVLAGVAADVVAGAATIAITPSPRIAVYQPGFRATVGAVLAVPSPMPSGTALVSRHSEAYRMMPDGELTTDPLVYGLVFYQQPESASRLAATWVVTPSVSFEPETLRDGVIGVDVFVPGTEPASDSALIGADGGRVELATGHRVDVPAAALPSTTAIDLAALNAAALGVTTPPLFEVIGAVSLVMAGSPPLARPVLLSIPRPASVTGGDVVLVLRLEELLGATRFVMVGLGRVGADRIFSDAAIPGVTEPSDAVTRGGRYVFARVTVPVGFATGTVVSATGGTVGEAFAMSSTLPVFSRAVGERAYALPAPVGPVVVSAIDPSRADFGESRGLLANAGDVARLDIQLVGNRPGVISVSPSDGAENVSLGSPVVVTFSGPIDPGSLGASPVRLQVETTGEAVAGAVTLDNGNRRLTFRPSSALGQDVDYRVTVDGELRDIAGRTLAAAFTSRFRSLDTTPPPQPAAGAISLGVPDADGFVTVTATQGTATPRDVVRILNRTQDTFAPVLVNPNGGFAARVSAAPGDELVLAITDQSGNQTTVVLQKELRQVNRDGSVSAVVGPEGGRVEGPAGIAVDVPAGAFTTPTVMTVRPIAEADFPVQLTAEQRQVFRYSGGFELDFRGARPATYLNVSIPRGPDDTLEDRWVLGQASTVDGETLFTVADTARLIDGRIMTASPPCPGVLAAEKYAFVKAPGRPLGLTYAPWSNPGTLNIVSLTGFSLGGISAARQGGAFSMPWQVMLHNAGGGMARNLVCLPILTGRVTVTPNRQKIRIEANQFAPLDRELVVKNETRGAEYRYPRHIIRYRFDVDGTLDDTYEARVKTATGDVVVPFEVAQAGPQRVSIKLMMDAVTAAVTEVVIVNTSVTPQQTAVFPQATAAVSFPVAGSSADLYTVGVIDADQQYRPIGFTIESPTGSGNLLGYAPPVTIDPGTTVVLVNMETGAEVVIPSTAHDGAGGFSHGFDGDEDDAWRVEVRYPDGKVDGTPIPRMRITVANPVTHKVVHTLTLPTPPADEPLALDPLAASSELPTLTNTPSLLSTFDPAAPLTFTFSGPLDRAAVLAGVTLVDAANKPVTGEVRLSNGNTAVTFVPAATLRLGTHYTLKFAGLVDPAGRPLPSSTFSVTTFGPTRTATAIGEGAAGWVRDVEFMRKPGVSGKDRVIAVMSSPFGYDSSRLVTVDVTDPQKAITLGSVDGPMGRHLSIVPDAEMSLGGASPCGGSGAFDGDLVITSFTSTGSSALSGSGSSAQFYDITDLLAPCHAGSKGLNSSFRRNSGTIFAPGAAVGVAGLKSNEGVTAYFAVSDLGILSVPVGPYIPAAPVGGGERPSILPGAYYDVQAVGSVLGAIQPQVQTFDLIDPGLAKLASFDLSQADFHPGAFTYAPAFPIDADSDGLIQAHEQHDLVLIGGSRTGAGGAVAVLDITDQGEPELIAIIPVPTTDGVSNIAADPVRRRIMAAGFTDAGDWRVFLIDLSGQAPLQQQDIDKDDIDDRIVWQSPQGEYWNHSDAFYYDRDRGLLYVPSAATGGLDAWSMTSACCDLGVDMSAAPRDRPDGDRETLLVREKTALQKGLAAGLAAASACGVPILSAGGAGTDHLTIIEQGSGACFWKPEIGLACDGTYQVGISDHDFEVLIPERYFAGANQAKCVVDTLTAQFTDPTDGTPKPIDVGGTAVTFRDITFFPVRKEGFEAARLDILPPSSAGADASGDFGLGRQALLLKWLLEGEYIEVPGFNLAGKPLEEILTTLRTSTRIAPLEGHEWSRLQQYALAKSKALLRIVGAADARSSLHPVYLAQLHDAGKAGIRAALGRMAVEPAALSLLLDITRGEYEGAGCLAITANTGPAEWVSKPCDSFEDYVASTAGRASRLPSPVFPPAEVANVIHRFYRVKAGTEPVARDADAAAFVAATATFIDRAVEETEEAYDRDLPGDPQRPQRAANLAALVTARAHAIARGALHVVPRVFNFGFLSADQVEVRMHRGVSGPGPLVKSIRVDLNGAEQRFLDREESIAPAPIDGVTPLDRNLNDTSWIDPGLRTPVFVLGSATDPNNPYVRLDANLNEARYVVFTIDLPEKKVREGDRENNVGGFWYYVLDPANPGGAPAPGPLPLPMPDPDGDLLTPDPECKEPVDLEISQGLVFPADPSIEFFDRAMVDPGESATVRVLVKNTSSKDVADATVCTSLGGSVCSGPASIPANSTKTVELAFTAPTQPSVLEAVATVSAPAVGVRASLPMTVTVGCEPFVLVPPLPDPNPNRALNELSEAMQGGQAIRYLRAVERGTGRPVPFASIAGRISDSIGNESTIAFLTNAAGDVVTGTDPGMAIPIGKLLPAGTIVTASFDTVQGSSLACSGAAQFEITVLDRNVKREWKGGSSISAEGTIEVGLSGKKGSGLSVALTESKLKGRQQIDLGRTFSSELGVFVEGPGPKARLFLGAATLDAAVNARAGGALQQTYSDQHTFPFASGSPSLSPSDAGAFAAVLLAGMANDPMTAKILTRLVPLVDPAPKQTGETVAIGIEGSASAAAKAVAALGVTDTKANKPLGVLGFGAEVGASGGLKLGYSWSLAKNPQKHELTPAYEIKGSLELGASIGLGAGQDLNDPKKNENKVSLLHKLRAGIKGTLGGGAKVSITLDTADDYKFKKLTFALSGQKGYGWLVGNQSGPGPKEYVSVDGGAGVGAKHTITFTFTDQPLLKEIVSTIATIEGLVAFRTASSALLTDPATLGLNQLNAEIEKLVVLLVSADAEYEITEERGDAFTLPFGGSLGIAGVSVELKKTFNLDRAVTFTTEKGRLRRGGLYPLAKYTKDDLVPDVSATGKIDDLQAIADAAFGSLTPHVSDVIDVVSTTVTGGPGVIRSRRTAELQFNGDNQPGLQNGLYLVSFTYDPLPQGEEPLMRRPDDIEWALDEPHYGVGGYHQFGPPGLQLVNPATLTFFYRDDEVVNVDESRLRIYRWDDELEDWLHLGGTADPANNTVTVNIDRLGLFTVAAPMPAREVTYTATYTTAGDALDPHTIVTYMSAPLVNNDGSPVPDGTLYTVAGARPGTSLFLFGNILTPDEEVAADGVQVRSQNGVIRWVVDYPSADGVAIPLTFSRQGTAISSQSQPIRPVQP